MNDIKSNNTHTNRVRAGGAIGAGIPVALFATQISPRYAIPAVTAAALTGAVTANGLFYIGNRIDIEKIKPAATIAGAGAIGGATVGIAVNSTQAFTTPSYLSTKLSVGRLAKLGVATSLISYGLFAGGKRCYDKMYSVANTNSNSETPPAPGQ